MEDAGDVRAVAEFPVPGVRRVGMKALKVLCFGTVRF